MQAVFNDVYDNNGLLVYSITYISDDGTLKTTKEYATSEDITFDSLQQVAFNEVSRFTSAEARKQKVAVPLGFTIPIAEPKVIPPVLTQDQIDMNNYFEGKRVVLLLSNLLKIGRKEVTQEMLNNAVVAWNNMRLDPTWESITSDELNILLNGTP